MKKVEILRNYKDVVIGRTMHTGEVIEMDDHRAEQLVNHPENIVRYVDSQILLIDSIESSVGLNTTPPLKTPESFMGQVPGAVIVSNSTVEDVEEAVKELKKKKKKVRNHKGAKAK